MGHSGAVSQSQNIITSLTRLYSESGLRVGQHSWHPGTTSTIHNPAPWLNTGSPWILPGVRWAASGLATTVNITWHQVQPSTQGWSILCWCKGNFDCYREDRLFPLENVCRYEPFLNLLPLISVRDTTLSFRVIHEQLLCRPLWLYMQPLVVQACRCWQGSVFALCTSLYCFTS